MRPVEEALLPITVERGPHETYLHSLVQAMKRHFAQLAARANGTLPKDGSEALTGPLMLGTYTTGTLPTASDYPGAIIYVSDGAAGARFRGSHAGAWVNLG